MKFTEDLRYLTRFQVSSMGFRGVLEVFQDIFNRVLGAFCVRISWAFQENSRVPGAF